MATDPLEALPLAPNSDELPLAPLSGTRSQAMQRLQVGLFGLGAMVLLVALANIINSNREQNEAMVVPEAAPTVAAENGSDPVSDPLADAGIVPDMPTDTTQQGSPRAPATGDADLSRP
jgi:hypothetical protein